MAERKNEAVWIESRQRWQINVQKDGERRTFVSSKKNSQPDNKKGKIEAEKKADKWLEEGIKNERIRFGKLYEDFLAERKRLKYSESDLTMHEYIGRIWLSPRLEHKRVLSITMQMWQDCINDAFEKGRSKKTLKDIRGSITAFIRYARKRGIKMEPLEDIVIPKDAYQKEKVILQPSHIKKLFSVDTVTVRGKIRPVYFIHAFRFMVLTGLRRGEICALKNDDINGRVLNIRRSLDRFGNLKKGGKTVNAERSFYIMDLAYKVLEDQKAMLKKLGIISPYVFPDEYGDLLDSKHLYIMWKYYAKQHDIPGSLHELRHTMISVAKADVPEELLKPIIGHSASMDTFGVYGHEIDGEMIQTANLLNAAYSRLLTQ
jgi:integrase